ncbi:MAG: hypothetical protein ACKVPX_00615 [Myxococcaceae bacterium]
MLPIGRFATATGVVATANAARDGEVTRPLRVGDMVQNGHFKVGRLLATSNEPGSFSKAQLGGCAMVQIGPARVRIPENALVRVVPLGALLTQVAPELHTLVRNDPALRPRVRRNPNLGLEDDYVSPAQAADLKTRYRLHPPVNGEKLERATPNVARNVRRSAPGARLSQEEAAPLRARAQETGLGARAIAKKIHRRETSVRRFLRGGSTTWATADELEKALGNLSQQNVKKTARVRPPQHGALCIRLKALCDASWSYANLGAASGLEESTVRSALAQPSCTRHVFDALWDGVSKIERLIAWVEAGRAGFTETDIAALQEWIAKLCMKPKEWLPPILTRATDEIIAAAKRAGHVEVGMALATSGSTGKHVSPRNFYPYEERRTVENTQRMLKGLRAIVGKDPRVLAREQGRPGHFLDALEAQELRDDIAQSGLSPQALHQLSGVPVLAIQRICEGGTTARKRAASLLGVLRPRRAATQ